MSSTEQALKPMLPVYSGQIIGAVVKALDLDHPVLKERTARRFFAGQSVNEHNHTEIFLALGEALVDRGIVPDPPLFSQYDATIAKMLPAIIARAAMRWDSLVAKMQSYSGTTDDPGPAIADILRLVVVDLAIRVFAFLRLSGMEPSGPETPLWAQENGGGKLLRELADRARLSRNGLSARLGVSDTAVDNWLDGKNHPTHEHTEAIASVLASQISDASSQQIAQHIHRLFTFATLADLVAAQIGRGQVIHLSTALSRFIWLITEDVKEMNRPPIEEACGVEYEALAHGTAHPSTHTLLRNLAILETDSQWKKDIISASVPWDLPFQHVGVKSSQPRSAAGLAQDILDIPNFSDPAQEALAQFVSDHSHWDYDRLLSADLSMVAEIFETQPAHLRAITRDYPASPSAHFALGSLLGKIGEMTGRRNLVNEGITECKIASMLLPEWDNPAVEPGIMLANIGAYDEALAELSQAAERMPEVTPHLQFATGYVLMELSHHADALEQFESVIASRPDYALAHNHAARCAFSLGETTKAIKFAKTARRLGEPAQYNAWQKRRRKSKTR